MNSTSLKNTELSMNFLFELWYSIRWQILGASFDLVQIVIPNFDSNFRKLTIHSLFS